MLFDNIFNDSKSNANSAEQSARKIREFVPGTVDDPSKRVLEYSPEAKEIANNLTAFFQTFQTAAADQLTVSKDPQSTTGMASSTNTTASENLNVTDQQVQDLQMDDLPKRDPAKEEYPKQRPPAGK